MEKVFVSLTRWVLLPPEVLPDYFLCDDDCSETEKDDLSVLSWYHHVLPQIKERSAPRQY